MRLLLLLPLLLACALPAQAQRQPEVPDLAVFKSDGAIAPEVWNLGAGSNGRADARKQADLPRRYRARLTSHKPGASPESLPIGTREVEITPLGEGYVFVRAITRSEGGAGTTIEESLTWRGVVKIYSRDIVVTSFDGVSGVQTVMRATRAPGSLPDVGAMAEGSSFNYAMEWTQVSARIGDGMQRYDEKRHVNGYTRRCTAGAGRPASSLSSALRGQVFPLGCTDSWNGKEYTESLLYLDAYAMAVQHDFFGGKAAVSGEIFHETQVEVLTR